MSASLVGSEMCIRDSCILRGGHDLPGPPRAVTWKLLFTRSYALAPRCKGCLLYTSDAADDM
eukprot:5969376-Alexandrium_andersonii.AAC.1